MYHNVVTVKRKPVKDSSPTEQEYRYIRCLNERDPSFSLVVDGDSMPHIQINEGESLSIVDYSLLMNYIDSIDVSDITAVWMRHNMNFFSQ